jgi:RNA-binding protein YlmH
MHNISSISGNFKFEPCSHGDFLGAILGAGIERDAVGDILMQVSFFFQLKSLDVIVYLFF